MTGLRVYAGTVVNCGTTPASPRLDLSYSYQNNGNVSQVVDATRAETLNYTYDELVREFISKRGYTLETVSYILRGELILGLRKSHHS